MSIPTLQKRRQTAPSRTACSVIFALAAFFVQPVSAAVLTVTNANDALVGSLRQAIQDASPSDRIVFQIPTTSPGYSASTATYTIGLTSGELLINKNLTIDSGGQKIVIQRSTGNFRIVTVAAGTMVTLSGLTIQNGHPSSPAVGGGIANLGTLTVMSCHIRDNAASGSEGGGIYNAGVVRVSNSTLSGNSALQAGAISNGLDATMQIDNCTVSGNDSASAGGALGAVLNRGNAAAARMRNTIVVGNLSPDPTKDVYGPFTSEGYNLIGTTTGSTGFGATGDQIGATTSQAALGPLQDNGGPTLTRRPMPGSVAIDQGKRGLDANGQPINTDQRGYVRPVDLPGVANAVGGDGSDIGAVETAPTQPGPSFTVTNTAFHADGCTVDDCTFLDAVAAANANGDTNTISFAPNVTGLIPTFAVGGIPITAPVNILGPGARSLALTCPGGGRILNISSANVSISALSFRNGAVADGNGGAIYNGGGLTLRDCTVAFSLVEDLGGGGANGGGLYSALGTSTTLIGCTFVSNSATQFGGGVYTEGNLTATNCTFSSNSALRGGGVILRGAATITLRNCTFSANTATDGTAMPGFGGGGLFCEGGAAQHFIGNTLIAGNNATNDPDIRGNYTSEGHNFIGKVGDATGLTNGVNGNQIGTVAMPLNPQFGAFGNNGGPTDTWTILASSAAIDNGDDALALSTDQRGFGRNGISDIGAFEFNGFSPGLANISTRLSVGTGDNVLIGGFIVTGMQPKKVILRAIGPSLPIAGRLANPTLELFGPSGTIATNDNWRSSQETEITATNLAPMSDLESAIVATLPQNAGYTAIVRGAGGGTGVGLVEVYDLDRTVDSNLANISTRGFVQSGDNVLIGGFIVANVAPQKVIVRAIGPSLPVSGKLTDPTLEVINQNGITLATNDDWRSTQEAEIIASTVPPTDDRESAIVITLPPGTATTAIVRGKNNSTGVALVEVFALN